MATSKNLKGSGTVIIPDTYDAFPGWGDNLKATVAALVDVSNAYAVWKTYRYNQAYTNGTPTLSHDGPNITATAGGLVPYQTIDGAWRLRGDLLVSHDAVTSITFSVSGVTMARNACMTVGGLYATTAYFSGSVGYITIASPYGETNAFWDVELASKPTWAD